MALYYVRTSPKEIESNDDHELAVISTAKLSVLVGEAFAVIFEKTSL